MRPNNVLLIIMCAMQTACQYVATPIIPLSPTNADPIFTLAPTQTPPPTATKIETTTPTPNPNLGYWNELQYDTRKWAIMTYNDTEWTPQTYPVSTLEPLLTHNFIENCMIYLEEGRDLPAGWTYKEVPVIIGGHGIFHERIFMDEQDQELFMVIVGSYHIDFPRNEDKSQCIKDAERVAMTGMGLPCPSGFCGPCPGLPRTILKIGDMVKLFNPQMNLPVTEPGGNGPAGSESDWYFPSTGSLEDYNIEVIDGPVCKDDDGWWQLKNPNGITGWDSDDHFMIQP